MKIIITESQYEMLSNSLRRRITPDDFKYFDSNLVYHIDDSTWIPNFNEFSYEVISSLLIEFVYAKKHNANYLLYKYLELKGDQKNNFFKKIEKFKPNLIKKYKNLYKNNYSPDKNDQKEFKINIEKLCKKYKI